jgi:flagellin
MPLVINTNVASLNAQRNLTSSQNALNTALARLSSGLRINSAKDDAAGLAIATRFTTQINGLDQAVRNANDGISLAQTTGSALAEVTNNMQRIRELAVQSANATNSDSDRAALDAEVQQRLAEITRISQQTTFNGRHVLDGSFGSAAFQIGANVGETITVNLSQGAGASQIGQIATEASGDISSMFTSGGLTLAAGDLSVDGTDVAAGNYTSAADLATAIQTAATTAGDSLTVTVSGNELALDNAGSSAVTFTGNQASALGLSTVAAATTTGANGTASSSGLGTDISGAFNAITLGTGDFTIDGTDVTGTFKNVGELETAINAVQSGLASDDGSGNLVLTNSGGTDVAVGGTIATALGVDGTLTASGGTSTSSTTVASEITAAGNAVELGTGDLTIGGTDVTGVFSDAASLKTQIDALGVSGLSVAVNAGELDFTNSSSSAIAIGGSLSLGLPASVAAATSGTTDGTAASTGVNSAVSASAASSLTLASGDLTINGTDMAGTYKDAQSLVDTINAKGIDGVSAYYDSVNEEVHLNSQKALTVDGTKAGTGAGNLGFASAGTAVAIGGNLAGSSVKTVTGADDTISRIDAALSTISSMRSDLGAVQNRFESTIANLQAVSQNLSASRSRIQDADFAAETASMTRNQILQQAGTAILAQANSIPNNVLTLLRG